MENRKADAPYEGDMITNLMHLPPVPALEAGIRIERALPLDRPAVESFIRQNFSERWVAEAGVALAQQPTTCYIAIRDHEVIGFSCFDATAPDFFGPIGVSEKARGKKVGAALLLRTLQAMRERGYVYAVIGWVSDAAGFYERELGARFIEGGEPENSIYGTMTESPDD